MDISTVKKSKIKPSGSKMPTKKIDAQLEQLIMVLPCCVYWKNKEGVYLGCNNIMAKLIGFSSPSEIQGKTDFDLCWHEKAPALRKIDIKVMKTGLPITVEEDVVLLDGTTSTYLSSKIPFMDRENNEVGGIFGVSVDVTTQKNKLKNLEADKIRIKAADETQSNMLAELTHKVTGHKLPKNTTIQEYALYMLDYLENIIACMPGSVYWKDRGGIYRGGNDYLAKMAGFKSRKEIIGKTDYDFSKPLHWSKKMLKSVVHLDMEVMESGTPMLNHEELPFKSANGESIIQLSSKVPLFDKFNNVIGLVGISLDITELKKIEEALRAAKITAETANRAKTEFIANMSHDLRTPMSGIIGMAKILEKEGDSENDRGYGHIIQSSGDHLLSLLNDILGVISADEAEAKNLAVETFSLVDRIKHLENLVSANIKIEHLDLNISIDPHLPQYIVCDRIKLDRILLNLVSNALKFTHQGSVNIDLKLKSKSERKAIIEFTIRDTGIGIPEDKINKIFDRFYRVSASYDNKYRGHGLGLSIVQRYVAVLGGEISVQSEVDKGTTFTVTVPVQIGFAENVVTDNDDKLSINLYKLTQKSALSQTPIPLPTIKHSVKDMDAQLKGLVIEDDPVSRHVVKVLLQKAGFSIDDVDSGEIGFRQVMDNTYDLIVTDIGLPGMNGNEFTSLTRSWEKATHHIPIPIIGLSAHGANQWEESKLAGMDIVLTKPIDDAKINDLIERFFPPRDDPPIV